ncbi:hypothetical protein ACFVIM_32795 [Streptomyces sp. NPDC057638]|uniref:hypothetical protein n=1 Tax=Streptomyces sp. NPDC057638 TaxID=3346190 RepID=UPI0036B6E101
MTLKSLPVDAVWVRRLVTLAERPWDRAHLEDVFTRHGWARPGPGGRPEIAWGGGAGGPHSCDDEGDKGDDSGGGVGWRLELGDAPGEGAGDTYLRLPCALYWPPFDEEPEEAGDDSEDDEADEADEDDLDGDYGPAWTRRPEAARADLHAEYDRLGALIRAELGAPDETGSGEMDERWERWSRTAGEVLLELTDDINSYSHYDVIALRVSLAGPPAEV